jgi:hypothetical protein
MAIKIPSPVTTVSIQNDSYPTHYDSLGGGGWWAVPDESYLNLPDALYGIPLERRKFGMVVTSISSGKCYMLKTPRMTRGGSPPGSGVGGFSQDSSRPLGYGGTGLTDPLNWVEVFFRTVAGPQGKRGATGPANSTTGSTGITGLAGDTDWGFTGPAGEVLITAGSTYPAYSIPTLYYDKDTGNLSVGTGASSPAKVFVGNVAGSTSAMIGGSGFMVRNNAAYVKSFKTIAGLTAFYYGPQIPDPYTGGTALSFAFGQTFTQTPKGYTYTYQRSGHEFNADIVFATGTSGEYSLFNFSGEAYQANTTPAGRNVDGFLHDVIINKSAYLARGWTFTNPADPIGSGQPYTTTNGTATNWYMIGTGSAFNTAFDLSELQPGWSTSMNHDPGVAQTDNLPTIDAIYDAPAYPGTKVIKLSAVNQTTTTGFFQSIFMPGITGRRPNTSAMPNLDMSIVGNAGWTASSYGQFFWSSNGGVSRSFFATPSFGVVRQPINTKAAARSFPNTSGVSIDTGRFFIGYDDIGRRGQYTGFIVGEAPAFSSTTPDSKVNLIGIGGNITAVTAERKFLTGIGNYIRMSGSNPDGAFAIGSNINLLTQSFIGKPSVGSTRNDFFNPTGTDFSTTIVANSFPPYGQSLGMNISFGMTQQSFYNMNHNYWGNEPGAVRLTQDQLFTQYGNQWARQSQQFQLYYYSGGYFDGTGGFMQTISGTAGTISQTATTGTNLIVEKPWANFAIGSGVTLTYAYNSNIYVSGTLTNLITPNPSTGLASSMTGSIGLSFSQGITSRDGSYNPSTYYNISDWNIQYDGMTSSTPIDIYDVGVRSGASVGVTVTPPGMAINVGSGTTLTSRIWPNRWVSGVVTAYDFSSGGMTFTVNGSSEFGGNIFDSYQKYYGVEELVGSAINGVGGWTVSSPIFTGTGSFLYDPIAATAAAPTNYRSTVTLALPVNSSTWGTSSTGVTMTFRGHSGLQVSGLFTDPSDTRSVSFYGNWRRWLIDDWKVDSYTSATVETSDNDSTYAYLPFTGGFLSSWDNNTVQVEYTMDYANSCNLIYLGKYIAYSRSNPLLRIAAINENSQGNNRFSATSQGGQYQTGLGPWVMTGAADPDFRVLRNSRWINSRVNSTRTSLAFNFTFPNANPSQAGVSSPSGFQTTEAVGGRASGLKVRPGSIVHIRTTSSTGAALRRVQQVIDINTMVLSDRPVPSINPTAETVSMTGGANNFGTGVPSLQLFTGWHPWTVNDYLGMNMLQVGDNGTLSIGPAPFDLSRYYSMTNEGAAMVEMAGVNSAKYIKSAYNSAMTGTSLADNIMRPQLILTRPATASSQPNLSQFNPGDFWRGGTAGGSSFSVYLGLTGSEKHSLMMAQIGNTATYAGQTSSSVGPNAGDLVYGNMNNGFLGGPNAWLKYNADSDDSRNLLIPLYKI